jgi:aminoglycoside phosphotransferase family enzyme/predicted kinase
VEQKLPALIAAMARGEFYPDHPSRVELRQTHISYVFLAGPYVYKIKKPLRLPFLDYSTLPQRHHFCQEEIRLNRRLAPTTYLKVVPIRKEGEGFSLAENSSASGDIVEYAVKMNRLPEDQMLSFRIEQDSVEPDHIRAIAKKLASFHEIASVDKAEALGSPQAIGARVRANFQETRRFIDRTIGPKMFGKIQAYSEAFLRENFDLLQSRALEGRVREGHGDLRAEHVCLLDDIVIFDCIEFDEGLRYGDIASEIGFLSMDLDFLGARALSAEIEEVYASLAKDPALRSPLLPFYKCYRAYVRGKVESLKSDEQEIPNEERRHASTEAQRYFCLASRYTREKSQRTLLLVVCGMVGTGKSTVARLLSDLSGFPVLNSDQIRKKLVTPAPKTPPQEGYGHGIYCEEFNELTYNALLAETDRRLGRGKGVIVDATFKDSKHRSLFINCAANSGVPAFFIECRTHEATVRRRLADRAKNPDEISDATWEIYERMRGEFNPLCEIPEGRHFQVDTEHKLLNGLDRLEEIL